MKAKTVNYVYPAARVSFETFGKQVNIGSVYGITTMDNGSIYINTAEYPFHFELKDTEITVYDPGIYFSEYTTEVN